MAGLLIVAAVFVALVPSLSRADDTTPQRTGPQAYIGLYGGIGFPDAFKDIQGQGARLSDLDLNPGPRVGGKMGVFGPRNDNFLRWFGVELDLGYLKTAVRDQPATVTVPGLTASGRVVETDVNIFSGALHVIGKFPDGPLQPYVGVGPAVVHAWISEDDFSSAATNIALSALGGVRARISDAVGAFVEYKYLRAELDFKDDFDAQGLAQVHAVVGGVQLTF